MDNKLNQHLRQLRATQERIALEFKQKVLADGRVSCHQNCTHCCHYPLYVTILEGILVYQWLADHRLWVRSIQDKLKEAAARTAGLSLNIWLLSNTPCPLLDDDGLCRVYKGRPLYCRTAYSRGEPHFCHPHRFLDAEFLIDRKEPTEALIETETSILKRLRLRRVLMPFAVAVLYGERVARGDFDLRDANIFVLEKHKPW
jgi:Fe-S-cluster containining protein